MPLVQHTYHLSFRANNSTMDCQTIIPWPRPLNARLVLTTFNSHSASPFFDDCSLQRIFTSSRPPRPKRNRRPCTLPLPSTRRSWQRSSRRRRPPRETGPAWWEAARPPSPRSRRPSTSCCRRSRTRPFRWGGRLPALGALGGSAGGADVAGIVLGADVPLDRVRGRIGSLIDGRLRGGVRRRRRRRLRAAGGEDAADAVRVLANDAAALNGAGAAQTGSAEKPAASAACCVRPSALQYAVRRLHGTKQDQYFNFR